MQVAELEISEAAKDYVTSATLPYIQTLVAGDDIEFPVEEMLNAGVSVEELSLRLAAAAWWCESYVYHLIEKEGKEPDSFMVRRYRDHAWRCLAWSRDPMGRLLGPLEL